VDLNPNGCGLGLLISNQLSKGLLPGEDGKIKVVSKLDLGSTFYFFIADQEEPQLVEKRKEDQRLKDIEQKYRALQKNQEEEEVLPLDLEENSKINHNYFKSSVLETLYH